MKQEATLAEHIRRTELLEAEFKPVEEHVAVVGAVAKIAAALGALLGLAVAIKLLVT